MLDSQQLKVREHHSLLELEERKKKGGLLVSQPFHIPPRSTAPASANLTDLVRHAATVAEVCSYSSGEAPRG
jgi:hypothetical protein